jgi:hypothetical protein
MARRLYLFGRAPVRDALRIGQPSDSLRASRACLARHDMHEPAPLPHGRPAPRRDRESLFVDGFDERPSHGVTSRACKQNFTAASQQVRERRISRIRVRDSDFRRT